MNITHLALIVNLDNRLSYSTHICSREDWSDDALDETNGAGNWLIILADELPADFSVDGYTIVDGALVPASADVIACREAAALVASREAVRVAREARYESEPITSLYWSWIESGLESDRTAWIVAKNTVRTELPYPETTTAV